jgi:hypothetical protein
MSLVILLDSTPSALALHDVFDNLDNVDYDKSFLGCLAEGRYWQPFPRIQWPKLPPDSSSTESVVTSELSAKYDPSTYHSVDDSTV